MDPSSPLARLMDRVERDTAENASRDATYLYTTVDVAAAAESRAVLLAAAERGLRELRAPKGRQYDDDEVTLLVGCVRRKNDDTFVQWCHRQFEEFFRRVYAVHLFEKYNLVPSPAMAAEAVVLRAILEDLLDDGALELELAGESP